MTGIATANENGLRIGDAAALLGITPKAIRLYHQRGLLAEPERDESDYRRYRPADLVALARIVHALDVAAAEATRSESP